METAWATIWIIQSYTHNEIVSSAIHKTNYMTNGTKLQLKKSRKLLDYTFTVVIQQAPK